MDSWQPPPENPQIQPGEIHLWRAELNAPSAADWSLLSPEEQQRAARFRFDLHRARFVRAHAITRLILASYTGIPPHQLQIEVNRFGKPFLANAVRFNLSHSGGLMLLGVTAGLEIGVDVEIHAEDLDWRQIAANYFSPREIAIIEGPTQDGARQAEFYRLWTLKEAYLKASGQGLAGKLDQVEVQLGPEGELTFLSLPGGENEKHRWQVFVFKPASGASGAVVVEKSQTAIRLLPYYWAPPAISPD
jgi:4'-phosphopantetheinyl transferase